MFDNEVYRKGDRQIIAYFTLYTFPATMTISGRLKRLHRDPTSTELTIASLSVGVLLNRVASYLYPPVKQNRVTCEGKAILSNNTHYIPIAGKDICSMAEQQQQSQDRSDAQEQTAGTQNTFMPRQGQVGQTGQVDRQRDMGSGMNAGTDVGASQSGVIGTDQFSGAGAAGSTQNVGPGSDTHSGTGFGTGVGTGQFRGGDAGTTVGQGSESEATIGNMGYTGNVPNLGDKKGTGDYAHSHPGNDLGTDQYTNTGSGQVGDTTVDPNTGVQGQ